jgi:hypothetical protein
MPLYLCNFLPSIPSFLQIIWLKENLLLKVLMHDLKAELLIQELWLMELVVRVRMVVPTVPTLSLIVQTASGGG